MNSLPIMPEYIDSLAEYALDNFKRQNLPVEETKFTELKVNMENGNAIFRQTAHGSYKRKIFSCWRIFPLAKMIQDDSQRNFCMLKIRIEFSDGLIARVKYTLAPFKQK